MHQKLPRSCRVSFTRSQWGHRHIDTVRDHDTGFHEANQWGHRHIDTVRDHDTGFHEAKCGSYPPPPPPPPLLLVIVNFESNHEICLLGFSNNDSYERFLFRIRSLRFLIREFDCFIGLRSDLFLD
ncbi:hypothetical protein F2Q70_00034210 [Brassica cretica]|uniref:Uncharacterized protein n=1 Tax=Brassica cretica TaxID=69181 RepID=A0A8S9JU24_BRACR|nr:hypothetical protein F2Q70_00034210 [Brassica cretica]